MNEVEVIVKLQRTISEYERFCMDFLCMLNEGEVHNVVSYNDNLCPLLGSVAIKIKELLDKKV